MGTPYLCAVEAKSSVIVRFALPGPFKARTSTEVAFGAMMYR